jgi:hypothetical protein
MQVARTHRPPIGHCQTRGAIPTLSKARFWQERKKPSAVITTRSVQKSLEAYGHETDVPFNGIGFAGLLAPAPWFLSTACGLRAQLECRTAREVRQVSIIPRKGLLYQCRRYSVVTRGLMDNVRESL